MKTQSRKSVFETNSSSTHSLTLVMKSSFDEWTAGKVKYKSSENLFENNDNSDKLNIETLEMFNKNMKAPMTIEDLKKRYPSSTYLSYDEFCNIYDESDMCEFTLHHIDNKEIVSILVETYEE